MKDATLRDFLEMNLPKAKKEKKPKFSLGVQDSKLGNSILNFGVQLDFNLGLHIGF